jgi:hypothetical protein
LSVSESEPHDRRLLAAAAEATLAAVALLAALAALAAEGRLEATLAALAALAAALVAEAAAVTALAVAAEGAGASRALGLLLEGRRDDLRREVEVLAEVLDTLVGEVPVEPLPVEGLADVATGLHGVHELDDLEVADDDGLAIGVVAEVLVDKEILGGADDALRNKRRLRLGPKAKREGLGVGEEYVIGQSEARSRQGK